ncbi:MAG: efflux RND transporter permease subunit [Bacteroidota bacterium]|nr:efflux RND transporter permease subunit [Bacteroidota bacterium]
MKNLVTHFIKFPLLANLIILVLVGGGLMAGKSLKKSMFPETSTTTISVQVAMPGASPEEMEEGVATKVEQAIKGISGIKEVVSTSSENTSSINITTFVSYDIDEILTEVKNAVDRINSFPVNAEKPVVYKRKNIGRGAILTISGDIDLFTLKKYAQQVENDFLNSGLISQININGYPDLEISVEISEENLSRYNLTFNEIINAIRLNNRDIAAGSIKSVDEEILIRSRAKNVDPEIISNIVLRAEDNGQKLRIRDVANVKMQFSDIPFKVHYNGNQAIFIDVNKLPEEDLQEISTYLRKYIEEFNAKNADVKIAIVLDFMDFLQSRLDLLTNNGLIGILLILILLGLFLSIRLSFWVAAGIPISFLGMAIAASFAGITINMLSLFGMILVVGILVDDGIVIAENIYTHFERGKKARQAAIDGTLEVLPAVFTSVLTTIVAFMPLLFLQGSFEFLKEMAFVVIACLAFSLVEAFLVLPSHISSEAVLSPRKRATLYSRMFNRFRDGLEKGINFLKFKVYGRSLKKIIAWKYIAISFVLFLVLITAGLMQGGLIKSTPFPPIAFDQIDLGIAFKPGTGEAIVESYLVDFEKKINQVNEELKAEFNDSTDFITSTLRLVGTIPNSGESGSHTGGIITLMRNMEGAPVSSFDITNRIKEKIGEIPEADKLTIGGLSRFGKPVSISLLGTNLAQMEGATLLLKQRLNEISALKEVNDNNASGRREVQLKLKPQAYFLGLDHDYITNQIRQGFFGGEAQKLQLVTDEVRVWVRYPKEDRINLSQLEKAKIKMASGASYPLNEIVDYNISRGPSNIYHLDGSRQITIEADLLDPYEPVPPIIEKIKNEIEPEVIAAFPDVRFSFQGQQRNSEESMQEMMTYFMLAFITMYLIITINFKSFSQALLIILMIPLGWIGAAWGHGVEGIPVSILSAWGMIALAGVIINDAVVFVDTYNRNLLSGQNIETAVYNAGIGRFRAILLTSITTVAGLYPLILQKSFQAQFLIPMAVSVAYGILFGTLFILLFLPVFILIFNDIRLGFSRLFTNKKVNPEDVEASIRNRKRLGEKGVSKENEELEVEVI